MVSRRRGPVRKAKKPAVRKAPAVLKKRKLAPLPKPREALPETPHAKLPRGAVAHVKPGLTPRETQREAMKRAREAYLAGTLDRDYLEIALDLGISLHDAYAAAFGYLPSVGKAA